MSRRPDGIPEFTLRKQQFTARLSMHDEAYRAVLHNYRCGTLADCFDIVIAHNSFGLPCFRLKIKPGFILPAEVRPLALVLFKECLGTFAF
ncbi:hypothetical protein [Mucilaginibacter celer]|nr:hypothetical protein [Mucilaginibacter celer]